MIKLLGKLKRDELLRGSFVLFVMIFLYNIFNYIFQISMAKLLGPADYGILAVLMSLLYIFAIPSETIQTIVTKYVSIYNAKKQYGKIKDLLLKNIRKFLTYALISFILFSILAIFLSKILVINYSLILLSGLFIFIVFVSPIVRGVLQGTRKFVSLGWNMITESSTKVIFCILLVLISLRVYGAITGVILGSLLSILIAYFPLRKILSSKRLNASLENTSKSNWPIIVSIFSLVILYSADIIFARIYFSPVIAGQFAFISLIGKSIIFVSTAIGKAMFPLSIDSFEKGNNDRKILNRSLLMVLILCGLSLPLYFFFSEQIIYLVSLGSQDYLSASFILFNLGLGYSLMALSNIMILYNLSKKESNNSKKNLLFILGIVVLEIILLTIFNQSISAYSISILITSLLLFIYSIFTVREKS